MTVGVNEDVVPKGKFAEICGVTPGRVSQWISEGKIKPSSLAGEGRAARVIVAKARADLNASLDVAQRFGNGIDTRLDDTPPPQAETPAAKAPTVEDRIKDEKLKQQQFVNRRLAEEERARAGQYVRSDAAREQLTRVASMTLKVFEGGLVDLANELASKFQVPQREALHVLRTKFRDVREAAARTLRNEMEGMAAAIADGDGMDDVDTAGESGEAGD